jgi:hypothetical protein
MNEAYQLFPTLEPATEAALRASIKRWGVIVPVVKDQHGNILDGYHRARIAEALGITYPSIQYTVADDIHGFEIAHTLNVDRRHLDADQRAEMARMLRSEGHSLRAIAGALGVTAGTVVNDLATVQDYTVPDRIVGLDGKSRPSTRQPKPVPPLEESMAILDQAASYLDVIQAENESREQAAQRTRDESTAEMNELRDACRRLLNVLPVVEHLPAHEQTEAEDWLRELSKEITRHA